MPIIKTDKETILKDSIALFKLHGYHNTTMAKIGEACGLIKGSIYHQLGRQGNRNFYERNFKL